MLKLCTSDCVAKVLSSSRTRLTSTEVSSFFGENNGRVTLPGLSYVLPCITKSASLLSNLFIEKAVTAEA